MPDADLPFGLRHYKEDEFEELHAAGSKQITASLVPALLGESPFASRFAAMCHVMGRAPLKVDRDSPFLTRGHELQGLVAQKVEKAEGWDVLNLEAVCDHPTIAGFRASPDALAFADDKEGPGVGEIKVLSKWSYFRDWADGPPIWVQLQNQAQLCCCPEATWGFIAALIVERWEVLVFPTEPVVREFIGDQVSRDLEMIRRDELPPPEPNSSSYAAICQAFGSPEGEVTIQDPESMGVMMKWLGAQERARLAGEDLEDCRNHFAAAAPGARRIRVPPVGIVTATNIQRKEYTVPAKEFRSMRARAWSAKDGELDEDNEQAG